MQYVLFLLVILFPGFLLAKQPLAFTDNELFLGRCREIVQDSMRFENFRRDPLFSLFYENVSEENGRLCLTILEKKNPEMLAKFKRMDDRMGNPHLVSYGASGTFSPTSLRYAKIAGELVEEFGSLEEMQVLEIGSGYGGLCRTLRELASPKGYALCGFKENLALSLKYVAAAIESTALPQLPENSFDLVISDLAFSEMDASLQKKIIQKVFKHAKRGFLICSPGHWKEIPFNATEHLRVKPLSRKELIQELTDQGIDAWTVSENPMTGKDYYVVVWR